MVGEEQAWENSGIKGQVREIRNLEARCWDGQKSGLDIGEMQDF